MTTTPSSSSALELDPARPLRPGYGETNRAIAVEVNFFPVRLPSNPIFDYTVEIQPETDLSRLKTRIFHLLEKSAICAPFLGHMAHDCSQRLVSAQKLPQPLDIAVPFYEDGEVGPRPGATVYTVSIKFGGNSTWRPRRGTLPSPRFTVSPFLILLLRYLDGDIGSRDYNAAPVISALNLVLQQHATKTAVRVGKNRYFFPDATAPVQFSLGISLCKDFHVGVPTYKQFMVNVNSCMTAFIHPGNLAEALIAFNRSSRAFAKSIKVTTNYFGFKKRRPIKAIATTSARNTYFHCEELGGRISVEGYYTRKHGIKLAHPADLPVVDIGSANRANYVPAELCEIEAGQPYRGKLNDQRCVQAAARQRGGHHTNGAPDLGLSPLQTPVGGLGLAVASEMPDIPGRELSPPGLTYATRMGKAAVMNGSWNIRNVQLHRGAVVASWWVLVVRDGPRTSQETTGTDPAPKNLVTKFQAKLQQAPGSSYKGNSGKFRQNGLKSPSFLAVSSLKSPKTEKVIMGQASRGLLQQCGMKVRGDPAKTLVTPPLQKFLDASREVALVKIRKAIINALKNSGNKKPSFILRLGDVDLGIHTVHMQLSKALGDERKQDQYLSNIWHLEPSAMVWLTKDKTMMVGIDVTHPGPTSRVGSPSIAAVVASVDDNFVQFPASLRIQKPDVNRESKEMVTELRDMLVERLLVYEKRNNFLPERIIVFRDGVSEGQFDIVVREEKAQILEAFEKLSTKNRGPQPYRLLVAIIICHIIFDPSLNKNTNPGTVVDKAVTAVRMLAFKERSVKATHYTVVYDEFKFSADELQVGSNSFSHFSGRGHLDREEEKARVFDAAKVAWGEGIHRDIRDSMFYI
ncbi:argonaute-like protein [Mycena leptocephala]|nr:argonaute-like protein [Mycena leptocephala]